MRVVLAGLFVFFGLMLPVALLGESGLQELGRLGPLLMPVLLLLLLGLAFWLFNRKGTVFLFGTTLEQQIEYLEDAGLLDERDYRATRAFGVAELEDEGLHYYVELENGDVLFLSGQYLYEYEPCDDDPELAQGRRFPCTRFRVRRHRSEGVIDVLCEGQVLEPEVIAPPFSESEYDGEPEDVTLLRDVSYDELKAKRLRGTAA